VQSAFESIVVKPKKNETEIAGPLAETTQSHRLFLLPIQGEPEECGEGVRGHATSVDASKSRDRGERNWRPAGRPLRSHFLSVNNQDAAIWMVVCQPRFFGIIPNGAAFKHGVLENEETR